MRGVIISSDPELVARLDRSIADLGKVDIVRTLDHFPDAVGLTRLLRAAAPEVLFVGSEMIAAQPDVVKLVESNTPGVQIVAFGKASEPEVLLQSMRAGIREFLAAPFPLDQLETSLKRVKDGVLARPPAFHASDLVYSFLPSKAGVGTSTIVLNVAVALSQLPDTKVILSDFDLNCGMMRFMLKLENAYSVADAAEHALDMDEALWPQLVSSIGNLDVLHAGKLNPGFRIDASQIRQLTDFMRRNYKALFFDLSGNLEKYSLEIMHESKRIFLVCTPEIPSLHLAREKYQFLRSLDLANRVSVLVNRVTPRPVITPEHIEQILGLPVMMSFPNDYAGVHRALTAGKAIDFKSELGRGLDSLAKCLVDGHETVPAPTKKRFLEYFSILPGRA